MRKKESPRKEASPGFYFALTVLAIVALILFVLPPEVVADRLIGALK